MDDEEMKHTCNDADVKSLIENQSNNYVRESDIGINKIENISSITSTKRNELEDLSVNESHQYNDDIKIIDLESRGEEGSVSSYGRSTSDSPNEVLPSVAYNGIPSNSASYSGRREVLSPHSDESTSPSPKESTSR